MGSAPVQSKDLLSAMHMYLDGLPGYIICYIPLPQGLVLSTLAVHACKAGHGMAWYGMVYEDAGRRDVSTVYGV